MVPVTIEIRQWHCDKVVDVPVLLVMRVPQLQVVIKTVFIPQVWAFACFVMPVLVPTPVEIPQVQFLACFVMPVVLPRAVEIPQVQFSGKVVVPVVVQRQLRGSMVL